MSSKIALAVVGYRHFNDYRRLTRVLDEWIARHGSPAEIVSGGCIGADRMAERFAAERRLTMKVLAPLAIDGVSKFARRDRRIAASCTHMVAFPSHRGKGTQLTIGFARVLGKEVEVHWV